MAGATEPHFDGVHCVSRGQHEGPRGVEPGVRPVHAERGSRAGARSRAGEGARVSPRPWPRLPFKPRRLSTQTRDGQRKWSSRRPARRLGPTASIASTPRGWEQIVTPRAFARELGKRSPGPGGLTPEAGQQCARERGKCTRTHAPCLLRYFGAMRFVSMTSLCDVLGSRRTKYGGFEVRVDPGVAFLGCTLCPYMGRSPLY